MLTAKTLGLRPTEANLARVDRLAAHLTQATGVEVRRGSVAASALLAGLDALERQHGLGIVCGLCGGAFEPGVKRREGSSGQEHEFGGCLPARSGAKGSGS